MNVPTVVQGQYQDITYWPARRKVVKLSKNKVRRKRKSTTTYGR